MPKTKIVINAGALTKALKAVIPHAERNRTKVLSSVRFEVLAGALAIVATDSRTLGCYRIPEVAVDDWGFTSRISLVDARRLLKLASSAHNIHDVTLTYGGLYLEAESFSDKAAAKELGAEHFPEWEVVLANFVMEPPDVLPAANGVKAAYLARFAHATSNAGEVVLYHGARNQPTLVTAPNFVGLVLPSKRPPDSYDFEWWVPGSTTPNPSTRPALVAAAS